MVSIFRREALEHQQDQWLGRISLVRPVSLQVLTVLAVAAAVGVGAFLAMGQYTRKARVTGVLVPQGGVVELRAQHEGVVLERRVREGETVRQGDVLFVLALDRATASGDTQAQVLSSLDARRRSLESASVRARALAEDQRGELVRRIAALEGERGRHAVRADLQRERLALAEQALAQFESLRDQDFIAPAQLRAKRQDVLEQRERLAALAQERAQHERDLASLQAQLRELPLKSQAQQGEIEREMAGLSQQSAQSEALRSQVVRAPHDGVVGAVVAEPGQAVPASGVLASLMRNDAPLQAHLYAPSSAIGFMRAEQPVLLRYHAFPYEKFGQQPGHILQVSRTPVPGQLGRGEAGAPSQPMYRITVALERQSVDAYGQPQPLVAGMQLDADVQLDRRRLIEWIFEPLLGIAGRV
ncbi:HlyD family efflux transporter periplasmic adaptor subunit [Aquincola sp. MAHUQ-54]|uniref:HlyD family efflux transporter periplasmic adaptor subunit n=1 Tax=Aquincola agrisoli TaxID=3119538 RepID=A0AAW9QK84_9BURK